MLKSSETVTVIVVMAISIAAEVLLAAWSQNLIFAEMPLNPSLETPLGWAVVGLGLVTIIARLGSTHERLWLIAFLFLIVTLAGSFFVSHFVLGILEHRPQYSRLAIFLPGTVGNA